MKNNKKDYIKSKQRHIRIYHSKRRLTAQMVFKLSTHVPKNLCVIELSGFKKNLKAVTTLRKLMPVESLC